jgi:serine/threonine protein kinase
MGDQQLMSLQPGTVLAGRYEVVKHIGAGSMGIAYACRDRELPGRMVAAKVLFPEVAQDKIAAARFRNEIFASYGVSHPNVVRAYEYLRDGDLVAYTMEYVGGGDLAQRLARTSEPIPVPEIVKLLAQMCSGVQAIHDAGIVHRDLKPENILLTKEGNVKIADFGIARLGHGPKLTEHGGVVGTIDYVSPEYMLKNQVDWRSDIYALGILGYEMITGESPFRGDSVYATMTKRLKSDARPPSQLRSECTHELDQIVLKAMARNPESRYQSAAEMYYDLRNLQPERSSGAPVMNLSRNTANTYVGPSLSPSAEAGSTPSSGGNLEMGFDAATQARTTGQHYAGGMAASSATYEASSGSPSSSNALRRIVEPAAWRDERDSDDSFPGDPLISARDGETERQEPEQMEQVLTYTGPAVWNKDSQPQTTPHVGPSPSIDPRRLARLSQASEQAGPSWMVDVVILVVTVLIGVGVGFACVRFLLPGAMPGDASRPVSESYIEP